MGNRACGTAVMVTCLIPMVDFEGAVAVIAGGDRAMEGRVLRTLRAANMVPVVKAARIAPAGRAAHRLPQVKARRSVHPAQTCLPVRVGLAHLPQPEDKHHSRVRALVASVDRPAQDGKNRPLGRA